jgi:dCMP deaminase
MDIARLVASRATCLRRQIGAVLVKDKHILTTGYNGAPKSVPHCLVTGCLRQQLQIPSGERHEICRAVHAEQNAIIQAALHGISTDGSTLYCTASPCSQCAKMLLNAGIRRIVFETMYPDQLASELCEGRFDMVRVSRKEKEAETENGPK